MEGGGRGKEGPKMKSPLSSSMNLGCRFMENWTQAWAGRGRGSAVAREDWEKRIVRSVVGRKGGNS